MIVISSALCWVAAFFHTFSFILRGCFYFSWPSSCVCGCVRACVCLCVCRSVCFAVLSRRPTIEKERKAMATWRHLSSQHWSSSLSRTTVFLLFCLLLLFYLPNGRGVYRSIGNSFSLSVPSWVYQRERLFFFAFFYISASKTIQKLSGDDNDKDIYEDVFIYFFKITCRVVSVHYESKQRVGLYVWRCDMSIISKRPTSLSRLLLYRKSSGSFSICDQNEISVSLGYRFSGKQRQSLN